MMQRKPLLLIRPLAGEGEAGFVLLLHAVQGDGPPNFSALHGSQCGVLRILEPFLVQT